VSGGDVQYGVCGDGSLGLGPKAIGLTIPQSLLLRAYQVIDP